MRHELQLRRDELVQRRWPICSKRLTSLSFGFQSKGDDTPTTDQVTSSAAKGSTSLSLLRHSSFSLDGRNPPNQAIADLSCRTKLETASKLDTPRLAPSSYRLTFRCAEARLATKIWRTLIRSVLGSRFAAVSTSNLFPRLGSATCSEDRTHSLTFGASSSARRSRIASLDSLSRPPAAPTKPLTDGINAAKRRVADLVAPASCG